MENTEKKQISEMSTENVRREIALLCGITHVNISTEWEEYTDIAIDVWRDQIGTLIPDWPNDTGAAYTLCVVILDRLNEQWKKRWGGWRLRTCALGVMYILENEDDRVIDEIDNNAPLRKRDAEALSRLALAALRKI